MPQYKKEIVMGQYIKKFIGRNSSLAQNLNFLWNDGDIYIMDNHRAAYWCWMRNYDESFQYNFFHIDAHLDTLSIEEDQLNQTPNIQSLTIDDYLALTFNNVHAIRWDNYLSLFLESYDNIEDVCFATFKGGDKPNRHIESVPIHALLQSFSDEVADCNTEKKWIINLDLDYFFCQVDGVYVQMLSDSYINRFFDLLAQAYKKGAIASLIICLSPECCGSWGNAELLCSNLCEKLGLDFQLEA